MGDEWPSATNVDFLGRVLPRTLRRMNGIPVVFHFERMDESTAVDVADGWRYPPPYDFYDATADAKDYAEFVDERRWTGDHWQARIDGVLVGFLTAEAFGTSVEIGLGLRPDLTGRGAGVGVAFVRACVAQVVATVPGAETLTLAVAEFNARAITTYSRCGFEVCGSHLQSTNGAHYPFVDMVLALRGR